MWHACSVYVVEWVVDGWVETLLFSFLLTDNSNKYEKAEKEKYVSEKAKGMYIEKATRKSTNNNMFQHLS